MKFIFCTIAIAAASFAQAQEIDKVINATEVERIERILSSDSLRGRQVFTPDIEKAADFIISEFKKTGLKPLPGATSYRQPFNMLKPKLVSITATINGNPIDASNVIIGSGAETLSVTEKSGYDTIIVGPKQNFRAALGNIMQVQKNKIVFLDTSFKSSFPRLSFFSRQIMEGKPNVIFVLTSETPKQYSFTATQTVGKMPLANIVGIIPGKSKPNEYVIFSGHYDHLGVGKPVNGDSIYNGANDDAAGTTAVIMLAKYFKKIHNNARTLVFAAFTAEEIGEYGSQYFSKQFNPDKVVAMFNIEMIGTESKWGKNSAYITGYEKTDMGKIMQDNLKGTAFTFYPDPYTDQNLFLRSDNASLARVGVPAHTISTSKMDSEPNYHKVTDEIGTLDMNNMAEIIKSIAISSATIVSGKDTPTRVKE